MQITSPSLDQTKRIAKDMLSSLANRHVIALTGELGAGKTAFAQGIADALGITYLPSPTFTLMDVYPISTDPASMAGSRKPLNRATIKVRDNISRHSGIPQTFEQSDNQSAGQLTTYNSFVHVDCYRLDHPQQLVDIGIEEHLNNSGALVVIEWADKIQSLLPADTMWVHLAHGVNSTERRITVDDTHEA